MQQTGLLISSLGHISIFLLMFLLGQNSARPMIDSSILATTISEAEFASLYRQPLPELLPEVSELPETPTKPPVAIEADHTPPNIEENLAPNKLPETAPTPLSPPEPADPKLAPKVASLPDIKKPEPPDKNEPEASTEKQLAPSFSPRSLVRPRPDLQVETNIEKEKPAEPLSHEQLKERFNRALASVGLEPAQGPTRPMTTASQEELVNYSRSMQKAVESCWDLPDMPIEIIPSIEMRLQLDQDGRLLAPPILTKPAVARTGAERRAEDAARRALISCQPYSFLPIEKYRYWATIELLFDPKDTYLP